MAAGTYASISACAIELRASGEPVQIFPAGEFDAPRGAMLGRGPWRLDASHAAIIVAAFNARRGKMPIDYEHQTLRAADNGQPSPASGWLRPGSMEWRPGEGLFAVAEWTARAAAHIDAGEYRYLSPVFTYDQASGEILDLLHLALVNDPAIEGMNAVTLRAAASRYPIPHEDLASMSTQLGDTLDRLMREKDVSTADLARAGGISESTMAEILRGEIARPPDRRLKGFARALGVAFDSLINTLPKNIRKEAAGMAELRQAILKALDLDVDNTDDEQLLAACATLKDRIAAAERTAAAAAKAGDADTVPRTVYDEVRGQLAALKAGADTAELDKLIEDGVATGRIPGQQTADWLKAQGIAATRAYLEGAPAAAAFGGMQSGGESAGDEDPNALGAEDLAVCAQLAIDPKDYQTALAA